MEVPVADHHEVIILMIQLSELCFRKGGKPLSAMKTFPSGPRGNFFWDHRDGRAAKKIKIVKPIYGHQFL